MPSSGPEDENETPELLFRGVPGYFPSVYLGAGTSGQVYQALCQRSNRAVAIKFLSRKRVEDRYLKSEILNHRILCHPHIIKFLEVLVTDTHIGIVMEYASGGSLLQFVRKYGRLNETIARWFFQQLVIAVDYCHKKGVANRDLKLDNTLLQVKPGLQLPLLKLCDFGYSKADHNSVAMSRVGSLAYMAPEVVGTRLPYDGKLADIWSCGVMLYAMLVGSLPFVESSAGVTISRIVSLDWQIPEGAALSAEVQDLLQRILTPVENRVGLEQITAHPWFQTNLPAGSLSTNARLLQQQQQTSGHQGVEEIEALLENVGMAADDAERQAAADLYIAEEWRARNYER